MAEADRQRLRERALALPVARLADFVKVRPPAGVDPSHLRRIDDTTLRTKLVETRLAEGLQSPKGPQRIASIVRIYPDFDAPAKERGLPVQTSTSRQHRVASTPTPLQNRLPTVEDMEALVMRVREVERDAEHELAGELDERITSLAGSLGALRDEALETAHADLGNALAERKTLRARIREEAFRRIDADDEFPARMYLRYLRR